MKQTKRNNQRRQRRSYRVRNTLRRGSTRLRLCVFRSHKHIACQVIDDSLGKTLASASTKDRAIRDQVQYGGNQSAAELIGKAIAERAKEAGIQQVSFDRGAYKYHGRLAALAAAAREAGLEF